MWKCPRCSNEEKREYICRVCGYDYRKDFVSHRTIQPVKNDDVKERCKSFEQPKVEKEEYEEYKENKETKGINRNLKRLVLLCTIGLLCSTMARKMQEKVYLESVEKMIHNAQATIDYENNSLSDMSEYNILIQK